MSILSQLFNKNGDKIDPINKNYEIQLQNHNNRIESLEQYHDVYSTSETKTNKVYIDENGKKWPIYRKKIQGTYNNGEILLASVHVLISASGTGDPGTGLMRQIPYYEIYQNSVYTCRVNKNNDKLYLDSQLQGSNHDAALNVTFEYTKTTDS